MVRCGGAEVPFDQVGRTLAELVREGGPLALTADDALEIQLVHQPGHPITTDAGALAIQLTPDLLDAVHAEVVTVHAADLQLELLVALAAGS